LVGTPEARAKFKYEGNGLADQTVWRGTEKTRGRERLTRSANSIFASQRQNPGGKLHKNEKKHTRPKTGAKRSSKSGGGGARCVKKKASTKTTVSLERGKLSWEESIIGFSPGRQEPKSHRNQGGRESFFVGKGDWGKRRSLSGGGRGGGG